VFARANAVPPEGDRENAEGRRGAKWPKGKGAQGHIRRGSAGVGEA
jgi:hypothetical protein